MFSHKISIIIPVYNAEKYLEDCLNSCLKQSPYIIGKDYEIICINDGSTDNSMPILREYQKKGIIVYDQKNCGVSSARNKGLDVANGEYLWFVDSDDIIEINILSKIYDLLKSNNSDGCAFNIKVVPETFFLQDTRKQIIKLKETNTPPQMNNIFRLIVSKKYIVEHSIRFKTSISYAEDTLFVFYLRLYKHKFIYLNNELYYYRQVSTSLMHQKTTLAIEKSINSQMELLEEYKKILDCWNEKLYMGDAKPQERYYWTIQNILFSLLNYNKVQRKNYFNFLKEKGHYPYPILWKRLFYNSKTTKNFLINLFCLFFPYEWYYRFLISFYKNKQDTIN